MYAARWKEFLEERNFAADAKVWLVIFPAVKGRDRHTCWLVRGVKTNTADFLTNTRLSPVSLVFALLIKIALRRTAIFLPLTSYLWACKVNSKCLDTFLLFKGKKKVNLWFLSTALPESIIYKK